MLLCQALCHTNAVHDAKVCRSARATTYAAAPHTHTDTPHAMAQRSTCRLSNPQTFCVTAAVPPACWPLQCTASVIHPEWNDENARNDIALCFLDTPSRFAPVQLADTGALGLLTATNLDLDHIYVV